MDVNRIAFLNCGAAEIKNFNCTLTDIITDLTDVGTREGDLFIYSKKPIAADTAIGYRVKSTAATGRNAWKIHYEGRENGIVQQIRLRVGNGGDETFRTQHLKRS